MKYNNRFSFLIIIGAVCLMAVPAFLWANKETKELTAQLQTKGVLTVRQGEQELNYEEYLQVLNKWQQRKAVADSLIKIEEDAIASLKQQIEQTQQAIINTINETYAMLGITQADVDALDQAIAALRAKVNELDTYSAAELQNKKEDIKTCEGELDSLKKRPAAMLFKQAAALQELTDRLASIRSRMESYVPPKPPVPEGYTVVKGDWLSKLAEYDVVYGKGNFAMWPKIFRANRDLIVSAYKKRNNGKYDKPQDLIFPDQVFTIPR